MPNIYGEQSFIPSFQDLREGGGESPLNGWCAPGLTRSELFKSTNERILTRGFRTLCANEAKKVTSVAIGEGVRAGRPLRGRVRSSREVQSSIVRMGIPGKKKRGPGERER